jgi:hypothetical protein
LGSLGEACGLVWWLLWLLWLLLLVELLLWVWLLQLLRPRLDGWLPAWWRRLVVLLLLLLLLLGVHGGSSRIWRRCRRYPRTVALGLCLLV